MKLVVLLIVISLQVSASVYSQEVTLSYKNAPLIDVLHSIYKQTGYNFFINSPDIEKAKPVTLNLKSVRLDQTLLSLFKDQPFTYEMLENTIIVKLKPDLNESIKRNLRQAMDLSGQITDGDGKPLIGATVALRGTTLGAVTDEHGRFIIPNAPDKGVLLITMIGRESKEVAYKNGSIATIKLMEIDQNLKEIVIAYGTVKEKFNTSNIGSVGGEIISRQPVSNPLLALQGRVTSLFIQQGSGIPGSTVSVNVQGKNSMSKGNAPFYVIDGVPFTPDAIGAGESVSPFGGSGSNLNFINPADIASIEVLKDADATAIYGSRAANGAILITTKKGKAGQTKVDLNLQSGWGKVARMANLMNTSQLLDLRLEAKRNGNQGIFPSDYDINGVWDTTRNVDWQKELINGTAQYQNLQASVSGGSERTQFLIGAGYLKETTVFSGDFSDTKSSVHFNINHASPNQKFHIFLSGSYLQGINKLPQVDLTGAATKLAPNAPKLYNEDGTINWEPNPGNSNNSTFENPIAQLLNHYTDRSNNLISSSQLSYELIPGLVLKSSLGYNKLETNELGTFPLTSEKPENKPYSKASARYADKNIQSWIIEPQLTFNQNYSFGTVDGLLGSTFQNTDNYYLGIQGYEYSNDAQLSDLNAAGNKVVSGSIQSRYRYSAIFGRLNYRYKDRYIINLSARRDGSSRFGSNNLFHSFYSVGGAWLFSEEAFFKRAISAMNYGKIRITYGTTGNDQIGEYQFYSLYDIYGVDVNYQNAVGLSSRGLSNPYLQWEETHKLNLGVDLGFFDNGIQLNANYFRNRSSNQLLGQNLSVVTGFGGIIRNFPATVQNTGWEFMLSYIIIKGEGFNWRGSANLTLPQNKLIRYDGLAESGDANQYVIGQSINIKKAYSFVGVDPETGLYQFRNAKGELTSKPNSVTDKTVLINLDPKWYGGFSNTFSFKRFNLDVFIQFVKQKKYGYRFLGFPGLNPNQNQLAALVNRWHKKGDKAEFQKATTNFGEIFAPLVAAQNSDGNYSDGTYARLKNVSLSYLFSTDLIRRANISSARLYIQGQNLMTLTKYYGGADPETGGLGTLGPLRIFSLGTQLTF